MKKIFKILFGLLMTMTLFLAVDVNAEIKLDEEKKEIEVVYFLSFMMFSM